MDRKAHWDQVYTTQLAEELSWFQQQPALSIELIERAGVGPAAGLVDVGGGDSRLVEGLLELGYRNLTVLDVSAAALERAQQRLGDRAAVVEWVASDVTCWEPKRAYDVWHDRAVFHFLTEAADRRRYVEVMRQALKPSGHAVIATFSLEGPPKCSGLDVCRYSAETLARKLGPAFSLDESREQVHQTPAGKGQAFVFTRFRKAR